MTIHWLSLEGLFVETNDIDSVQYWINMRWEHCRKLVKKQVDKIIASWDPLVGKTIAKNVNSFG
jgi:hypothetical protein